LRRARSIGTRWLGVGLASCLAVVTLWLWASGRLALYINPSSYWFAVPMAILLLVGAALSFLLPLGAEEEHGHDHGSGPDDAHAEHDHDHDHDHRRHRVGLGAAVAVAGGVAASAVVLSIVLLPPASLSAEIAQSRDTGSAPLFAGADVVSLATHGDTSKFGVGDWASVFATATNPDAFEGDTVTLTGFATPASGTGTFKLTRLVITHCVIDAQPASIPVAHTSGSVPKTGQWVQIEGTVKSTSGGRLEVDASSVTSIAEPKDPYEY
jgi:uncharacterized repeat protein (TIGR03943 family)